MHVVAYLPLVGASGFLDNCQGTPRVCTVIHNFWSYPALFGTRPQCRQQIVPSLGLKLVLKQSQEPRGLFRFDPAGSHPDINASSP